MSFQVDVRSLFLIMAAIQAGIFSVLLFVRSFRQARLSDKLLAGFLISLAATLSEHIAGWMGWYDSQELTFFPFGGNFLFAPLAYLYVKSITNIQFKLSWKECLNFVPASIYFTFHLSIWQFPLADKMELMEVFAQSGVFLIEGVIDLLILTIYTVLAIRHYRAYLLWLPTEFSNLTPVSLIWIRNFLFILFLVCVVEWGFGLATLWVNYSYDVRFWDFFVRALLLYYLSIAGYVSTYNHSLVFENKGVIEALRPSSSKTNTVEDQLINRISIYMSENKPYLQVELTLSQLAQQLNLPVAIVSQSINSSLGKNFNDFVNEYRVREVCSRLQAGDHKTKTLLGVGMDCGFNSKATFNRSFKKIIGLTPKEWLENQNSESQLT